MLGYSKRRGIAFYFLHRVPRDSTLLAPVLVSRAWNKEFRARILRKAEGAGDGCLTFCIIYRNLTEVCFQVRSKSWETLWKERREFSFAREETSISVVILMFSFFGNFAFFYINMYIYIFGSMRNLFENVSLWLRESWKLLMDLHIYRWILKSSMKSSMIVFNDWKKKVILLLYYIKKVNIIYCRLIIKEIELRKFLSPK